MSDHLTDADLVARLKAAADGKAAGLSQASVAEACGVNARTFRASLVMARERGLTPETVVVDPIAAAKLKITQQEAEIRGLRREHIGLGSLERSVERAGI